MLPERRITLCSDSRMSGSARFRGRGMVCRRAFFDISHAQIVGRVVRWAGDQSWPLEGGSESVSWVAVYEQQVRVPGGGFMQGFMQVH